MNTNLDISKVFRFHISKPKNLFHCSFESLQVYLTLNFTKLINILRFVLIRTKVLMLHPIQHQHTTNPSHIIHLLHHMDILNPHMDIQSQRTVILNQHTELQNQNMGTLNQDMDHPNLTFLKNLFYWPKDLMRLRRSVQLKLWLTTLTLTSIAAAKSTNIFMRM